MQREGKKKKKKKGTGKELHTIRRSRHKGHLVNSHIRSRRPIFVGSFPNIAVSNRIVRTSSDSFLAAQSCICYGQKEPIVRFRTETVINSRHFALDRDEFRGLYREIGCLGVEPPPHVVTKKLLCVGFGVLLQAREEPKLYLPVNIYPRSLVCACS